MISAFVARGRLGYWEKRFAATPRVRDAFLPALYLNCPDTGRRIGFVRQPVFTIMIDLLKSDTDLAKTFRANTRNEISRAAREGAVFAVASSQDRFLALYASAAQHNPLPPTTRSYLQSLGDNVCITEGNLGGELLTTHLYVVDRSVGRVRLIRSVSTFRDMDRTLQATVGRVNRFLHFQDMLHFRREGLRWYDLGGYHPETVSVGQGMRNISDFKASFGGTVVQEANYLSAAQYVYRRIRTLLRRPEAERNLTEDGA